MAGFGNLAGQMDIYDLEKDMAKICTIEASNASVCEWSPDGKHILTATTSPRLRVDNGIRVWHAGGPLMYNEDLNELYHVCWRPQPASSYPLQADPLLALPAPHVSASNYLATKKTPSKPAGAYRPPGARGQVTPLAFKREDEGGAAHIRDESSYVNGGIKFGKARPRVVPGTEPAEEPAKLPPGAAPGGGVSLTGTGEGADGEPLSKAAKKNAKKREAKKAAAAAAAKEPATANDKLVPEHGNGGRRGQSRSPNRSPSGDGEGKKSHERSRSKGYVHAQGLEPPNGPKKDKEHSRDRSRSGPRRQSHGRERGESQVNGNWREPMQPKYQSQTQTQPQPQTQPQTKTQQPQKSKTAQPPPAPLNIPPPPIPDSLDAPEIDITLPTPTTPGSTGSSTEKKVRGLLKKIRAIEDLKMRLAGGEKLEDTQMRKIESEEQVRGELGGLGFTG